MKKLSSFLVIMIILFTVTTVPAEEIITFGATKEDITAEMGNSSLTEVASVDGTTYEICRYKDQTLDECGNAVFSFVLYNGRLVAKYYQIQDADKSIYESLKQKLDDTETVSYAEDSSSDFLCPYLDYTGIKPTRSNIRGLQSIRGLQFTCRVDHTEDECMTYTILGSYQGECCPVTFLCYYTDSEYNRIRPYVR